jgi:dolichyl-phosphate-mannose-protein mannosyltransferase
VFRGGRRWLWAIVAAGTAVRVAVAATSDGLPFDVESFAVVRRALADQPLEVYGAVGLYRWPYPPGFFGWIELSAGLERLTGLSFVNWIQLAPILADAALALLVAWFLRRRGASERVALAAAAMVAFGPSFVVISGYAVQIDSVAILPAAAALVVWERGAAGRAWQAGVLIGVAASIKTVPGLAVLALLPTVRDRREALTLVACAVAVPAALLLPFLVADPDGVRALRRYAGIPGMGGLTLAVQPELAERWLTNPVGPNPINEWIAGHTTLINLVVVGGVGAFLLRFRVAAPRAAAILFLAVLALGTGFFFQYVIWVLPFLLLAGHLRAALAMQLVAIAPAVLFYRGPWEDHGVVVVFAVLMIALWVGWLAGLVALGREAVVARRREAAA